MKEAAAAANNADTVTTLFSLFGDKDTPVRACTGEHFINMSAFGFSSARDFMLACKQWQVEIQKSV